MSSLDRVEAGLSRLRDLLLYSRASLGRTFSALVVLLARWSYRGTNN